MAHFSAFNITFARLRTSKLTAKITPFRRSRSLPGTLFASPYSQVAKSLGRLETLELPSGQKGERNETSIN